MYRIPGFLLAIPLFLALVCGCSGNNDPIIPSPSNQPLSSDPQTSSGTQTNRYVWGIWDVKINPDLRTVQIIPRRTAGMHLNCVRLLEVMPCTYCLGIEIIEVSDSPKTLKADVSLTHPYPGNHKLTAFDVRGIFISNADFLFPISQRSIALSGINNPVLLNPDGYTPLFNPSEFPETQPGPPALKYFPGKWSTGEDLTANLNPFVAYARTATRRLFFAGGGATRTVNVLCPDGPLEFGYAVDACWLPVAGPVTDPVTDFPPEANCLEAYRIDVKLQGYLDDEPGSSVPIEVEVFDHQGLETIASVTIEAPQLFSGDLTLSFTGLPWDESWIYSGSITNESAGPGYYPLLVKVTDTETDPNLGTVDAYQVLEVSVGEEISKGWVVTWAGEQSEHARKVAVDSDGNIFVTGWFGGTIDLDPGPLADWRETFDPLMSDVFLVKLDPEGSYLWGHTWGRMGNDTRIYGVAADIGGYVYVTGQYSGKVDFDPGPGVEEHTGNGDWDVYVTKFSPTGEHVWARTWGGDNTEAPLDIEVSGGQVITCGWFGSEAIDFNPGPGSDMHYITGGHKSFLSNLSQNGDYHWARTWGGANGMVNPSGVATDTSGSIYVAGDFQGTVDFDPGSGNDLHSTSGDSDFDAFLSKFGLAGNHLWVRVWGGTGGDGVYGMAGDGSGNSYVIGNFEGTVDFDPGPGIDTHLSSDGYRFLTTFDSSGAHLWACNWGTAETELRSVAADGLGGIYITGVLKNTVDLDPGPGVSEFTSNGLDDVWLSKFHSNDSYLWSAAWGGEVDDVSHGICANSIGFSYIVGCFGKLVDFDPGQGTELHQAMDHGDGFLSVFPPDGNW